MRSAVLTTKPQRGIKHRLNRMTGHFSEAVEREHDIFNRGFTIFRRQYLPRLLACPTQRRWAASLWTKPDSPATMTSHLHQILPLISNRLVNPVCGPEKAGVWRFDPSSSSHRRISSIQIRRYLGTSPKLDGRVGDVSFIDRNMRRVNIVVAENAVLLVVFASTFATMLVPQPFALSNRTHVSP